VCAVRLQSALQANGLLTAYQACTASTLLGAQAAVLTAMQPGGAGRYGSSDGSSSSSSSWKLLAGRGEGARQPAASAAQGAGARKGSAKSTGKGGSRAAIDLGAQEKSKMQKHLSARMKREVRGVLAGAAWHADTACLVSLISAMRLRHAACRPHARTPCTCRSGCRRGRP
jgi:hypothetical protein